MTRPRSGPSGRYLTPSCFWPTSGATDEHKSYALSWCSVHRCASLCSIPIKISTASGPLPCPGHGLEQAAPQWRFILCLTHCVSHSCAEKEIDGVCTYGCVYIYVPACVCLCISVCVCVYMCIQSSSAQSCPTLCDPMDCSTPGLPVHHQLLESTQTHVH